jgi:hypothetical protein
MKVEHQVQFAYISKELIKHLHKQMNYLQQSKLVIFHIYTYRKEQPSISTIDHLEVSKLQEIGELRVTGDHQSVNLSL